MVSIFWKKCSEDFSSTYLSTDLTALEFAPKDVNVLVSLRIIGFLRY